MNNLNVNDDKPIDATRWDVPAGSSLTMEVMLFYAQRAAEAKAEIDQLGAETSQRQDKMRLINDIIAEINMLTDEKYNLDISKNVELQEKLRVAQELGVHLTADKLKFNSEERSRLIENLHLQADSWDKENKNQTQKMEIFIKELDRLMMLLKETQKCEERSKRGAITGIKGG